MIDYIGGLPQFFPESTVIPKLYWDSYSQEQRIHALCENMRRFLEFAKSSSDKTNEIIAALKELENEFEDFKEHGFSSYYEKQVAQWINDNMQYIFDNVVKQVYFGLSLDGHFVAYIPKGWSDIVFDTGSVYNLDTYGRLILRWDVDDSAKAVDQTREVVR